MTVSHKPSRSRRSFFRNALASVAGSAFLPGQLFAGETEVSALPRQLRIVQITDSHVIDEKSSKHTKRMLEKITKEEKPDMILHTGDVIMDSFKASKQETADQWKVWKDIISDLNTPIHYCIGNHDIWWSSEGVGDPLHGIQWVLKELNLPGRYYSFTQNGWHFIFLDSTRPDDKGGYTGGIDEEQMRWLNEELQRVPKILPVLIMSHIPLLSTSIFDWSKCEEAVWKVSGGLMHADSHIIQSLLRKHPNVKACISGHLHLQDNISYDNIQYMGCGAVSGNWWEDSVFHQTRSGYAVIDLTNKGEIRREYKVFDWKVQ